MIQSARLDPYKIAARMERLPITRWHTKVRLIIGTINFCDAFDALTVAYVLPVLIPLWHMTPTEIGGLISVGYAGQVIGGFGSGWLGERFGRIPIAVADIVLFSLVSLSCILAQNYAALVVLRFLQGVGLGGEVPIANTYISEFAKSTERGRFVILQQCMFPVGLTAVALVGTFVVPYLGWRWMFVLGGLPVLLCFPMIRALPESPRWLAGRGRGAEADQVMRRIEAIVSDGGRRPLPPIPENVPPAVASASRIRDLFQGIYLRRTLTLSVLWFCAYLISYAMSGWLPSIFRTVFHASVFEANAYGFIFNLAGLVVLLVTAFVIDRVGRKRAYTWGFLFAAVPLLAVGFVPHIGALGVLGLAMASYIGFGAIPGTLGMYTAENYPNQMRALGSGTSSVPQRLSSVVGPLLVGMILPNYGVTGVFALFAVVAIVGGITCALFAVETAGRTLEELSPVAT